MPVKKNKSKLNSSSALHCSICAKKVQDIRVLTEVTLDVYSWYVNDSQKKLENLNGLWKKNAEYFCEACFAKYVKTLENFYVDCRNK